MDEEKIGSISRLTTYSRDEIIEKLKKYNGDYTSVIREYMGINTEPSNGKITIKNNQLNQEIYRQIRHTLDDSMRVYREKNPINIDEATHNLAESEKRQQLKNRNNNGNSNNDY